MPPVARPVSRTTRRRFVGGSAASRGSLPSHPTYTVSGPHVDLSFRVLYQDDVAVGKSGNAAIYIETLAREMGISITGIEERDLRIEKGLDDFP